MDNTIDLLKIKIEKAKGNLSTETINAIDAVDWRTAILGLRAKKGYTFEQLGDLELETELLLCGLASSENYPKELENRMKISKTEANELVNEMNNLVFKKIKEELIKNIEKKKIFVKSGESDANDSKILHSAGIEIIPEKLELGAAEKPLENREEMLKKVEKPEETHPILMQKLSGSFQTPTVKTDHSLENITKTNTPPPANTAPKIDPYREIPE